MMGVKVRSVSGQHRSSRRQQKIRKETSVSVTRVSRLSIQQAPSALQQTDVTKQRAKNNYDTQTSTISSSVLDKSQTTTRASLPPQPTSEVVTRQQLLEPNKEVTPYRKMLTPTSYRDVRLSKGSTLSPSFSSTDSVTGLSNSWNRYLIYPSNTIIPTLEQHERSPRYPSGSIRSSKKMIMFEEDWREEEKQRRRRRRRCCYCGLCPFCCSCCCCIASMLALILLLGGLAALLVALFSNRGALTTSTSTTTSSTSSSSTSTSSTSSTSTSSSSSTSTSSTSSTSTSSSSSTSTSTSSTTSASSTSTTTETTTTVTTTSSTTPVAPCSPATVGSSSVLYSASTGPTTYTCHAYRWIAPNTGLVSLAFELRNDPSSWYIDDVSVYHGGIQMLVNGGFESGTLAPGWQRTQAQNLTCGLYPGQVSSNMPRTGSYSIRDGTHMCVDKISQSFTAIAGDIYIVSYWYKTNALGTVQTISVSLS